MEIAGIAVNALAVRWLAERLVHGGHGRTAALLLTAQASGDEHVALSIKDREAVLGVLRDPPEGLCELRGVLMLEHLGRVRHGV